MKSESLLKNTSENAKNITASLKLVVKKIEDARNASTVSSEVF